MRLRSRNRLSDGCLAQHAKSGNKLGFPWGRHICCTSPGKSPLTRTFGAKLVPNSWRKSVRPRTQTSHRRTRASLREWNGNRQTRPTVAAPHLDSTETGR